ncbi:hypothetical protein NEMBOFW57_006322 [Staphylotrichum longicolle]|uniref:Amine oxidase domain-containing protein n=1 Tax=Staphylotrichum longicolle TaxID=669026 RepID=A0AAD4EYY8_9PEZI|nr:hypothetical protein NEMBOFW57_006322 [Staphylotrichum longicolle]
MPPSAETAPITNEDLTPHQIAIKRTKDAKARLATAHEGWTMIAQTLVKTGISSTDKALSEDMKAFGDAMIGRYAAASFLWRVLTDMPTEDWFGPKEKFDGTLRRLKTLKGLEGTLVCWEKIILDLLELVDEKTSINDPNALGQKVKETNSNLRFPDFIPAKTSYSSLAGLRCAEVLLDGGARVTILEARDRIGGRIHQSNLLDQIVDINEECLSVNASLGLKDFFQEKLAEGTLSEDQQARVLLLAEMWGSFIGDSWERQSLRWFWLEECLDGALPHRLQRSVQNASYSSLEKVYITFPAAFWDRPPTTDSVPQQRMSSPTETNEAPEGPVDSFPSFFHFLRPEYVPEEQKHWTIELVPLSSPAVFGSHAKPTLLVYTHDPCAEHVLSLIRGLHPDSAEYFDVLDRFFRPYYSRLPNYQPGHVDCTPAAILATDWHGDDLAGNGSYTNFQVSADAGGPAVNGEKQQEQQIDLEDDIRVMRAGLPERGIWFAGEHTAPFVALGTTTGAYWSGEAAALRVLGANGLVVGAAPPSANESN